MIDLKTPNYGKLWKVKCNLCQAEYLLINAENLMALWKNEIGHYRCVNCGSTGNRMEEVTP